MQELVSFLLLAEEPNQRYNVIFSWNFVGNGCFAMIANPLCKVSWFEWDSQVPIGGCYRLIDIPMSNCINSGIRKIFILTQFNSFSLNRHLSRTYSFGNGMNFGDGFVEVGCCYVWKEVLISELSRCCMRNWLLGGMKLFEKMVFRTRKW